MANRIAYFAYGSNMDPTQMKTRCSSARLLGNFKLENHRLTFPRRSLVNWPGSGVASISPHNGVDVEGVVYEVTPAQWAHLCNIEGVPNSYSIVNTEVKSIKSNRTKKVKTFVAIAEEPDASFDPDPAYLEAIQKGARVHKLSSEYLDYLKELRTKAKSRRQLGNVIVQTVHCRGPGSTTTKATCHECQREFTNSQCPDHPKADHTVRGSAPMQIMQISWRIGALHFHLAEPLKRPATDVHKPPIKESDVLEFLCREGLNTTVDGFVSRYREISKDDLVTVPEDDTIREKLVLPLLEAKTNYMLGNHFAVITLCGMVCEVLSVIRYEMSPIKRDNGQPLTEDEERQMFGSAIGNLTQERRIQLLSVLKYIDDQTVKEFDEVRNTRNRYIHMSSNPVEGRSLDAKRLYLLTIKLIKTVFGIKPRGDEFEMDLAVITYIANKTRPGS